MNEELREFKRALKSTSNAAKKWFWKEAVKKSKEDYEARGKLGDSGKGAVYVYIGKNRKALYVGESSRPIKRRMHDQTSAHKKARWWSKWKQVLFLNIQNRTDRLTLELLLILTLSPKHNNKPGAREINKMFGAYRS